MKTDASQQVATTVNLGGWTPQVAVGPQLSSLPLIDGLVGGGLLRMMRAAPHRIAAMLDKGRIDVGLTPSIDLQRMVTPAMVIPAGCIGCNGATETVRIFSQVAPGTIRQLYVDDESRSSAALAAVLWAETFGHRLELVPLRKGRIARQHPPQAVLVAGDRIPLWPADAYRWQMDLGAAWRELTDLPFVFSVWAMRAPTEPRSQIVQRRMGALFKLLTNARMQGMSRIEEIAIRYAEKFGWRPVDAARVMTESLQYEFTPKHRKGMDLFFRLAHKHALIDSIRTLTFVDKP